MVFNEEGCATIVLLYTYTESAEEKNMMKIEGKEMEKERKREKKV